MPVSQKPSDVTEDRLEARHVKAVATFGTRDTAEWRCECGAAWPCDATVLREAGERLAAALERSVRAAKSIRVLGPGALSTTDMTGSWVAAEDALAAWKEVTDG